MAKKKNRSQHIRDHLAKNPDAKPKDIIEALAKKGVEVSMSLVSAIKYKGPKKKAPKREAPDSLDAAISFVEQAGGRINNKPFVRDFNAVGIRDVEAPVEPTFGDCGYSGGIHVSVQTD